jgi:hypothetical protein
MLAIGTRVTDPENHATGVVIATPHGYFAPRTVRPTWLVFVAWDHLDGGWTPEDYKLLNPVN